MASNLLAMASNLLAQPTWMASNLVLMASTLLANLMPHKVPSSEHCYY